MSTLTKKEIEEYLCKVYFIDISNPITASIKRAYLDFCRTLHGLRNYVGLGYNAEKVLEREINELFKLEIDSQESFDQWHKNCCDNLIQCFEVYGNFHYGQAQKWINMSLKYIFVFDQQLTDNIYQYFHIPIDNVVLEGLKRMKAKYSFTNSCPWSKIDSYEEYLNFQIWFRNTFYGIPMDNEFRLWMGNDLEKRVKTDSEHDFFLAVKPLRKGVITEPMVKCIYDDNATKALEGSLVCNDGKNGIIKQTSMNAEAGKEEAYSMNIEEAIVEYAQLVKVRDIGGSEIIKTREQIKQAILGKYSQYKKSSIMPSDYCYNLVNSGIPEDNPTLFIWKGRNKYACVGLNYPYNGKITHNGIQIGECIEGTRYIWTNSNFKYKDSTNPTRVKNRE